MRPHRNDIFDGIFNDIFQGTPRVSSDHLALRGASGDSESVLAEE